MLNYEEFKEELVKDIISYLPERFRDHEVSLVSTLKGNSKELDGIVIKDKDSTIAPSIYINDFYSDYLGGRSKEEVFAKIAEVRVRSDPKCNVDPMMILDLDTVKDHIYYSVINYDLNRNYLKERPHRRFLDLAVIYYININECGFMDDVSGRMVVCITEDLMESYNITEEDLFKIAGDNSVRSDEAVISSFKEDLIESLVRDYEDNGTPLDDAIINARREVEEMQIDMKVLTNRDNCRGAGLMMCKDILKHISDDVDGDYYILPSSTDEVFIVASEDVSDEEFLVGMVTDANESIRYTEKFLSDNVYYYSRRNASVSLVNVPVCM